MNANSSIEWTETTWNPLGGCIHCSSGCLRCYAAAFANRYVGVPGHAYELGFIPRLVPLELSTPLRWRDPRRIFVNSISDFFLELVPDEFIIDVARVMVMANWHTYQVLTKRAKRMQELLATKLQFAAIAPHIWWGVSVENRLQGVPRIDHLRQAPATVRFLSVEPLLENLGTIDLTGIHWVIVGGESGPKCRPMARAWARSIRDQCKAVKVPFFFKQWGGHPKKVFGRMLDGQTYDEFPSITTSTALNEDDRRELRDLIESTMVRKWSSRNPILT
jgi:protein gp37